jgi:hypothetical protein
MLVPGVRILPEIFKVFVLPGLHNENLSTVLADDLNRLLGIAPALQAGARIGFLDGLWRSPLVLVADLLSAPKSFLGRKLHHVAHGEGFTYGLCGHRYRVSQFASFAPSLPDEPPPDRSKFAPCLAASRGRIHPSRSLPTGDILAQNADNL